MNLYELLKDEVKDYSEYVKLNSKHCQEVVVGGKIIKQKKLPSGGDLFDHDSFAIFVLDDGIGTLDICASTEMVNHYDFIKTGELVIFKGLVNLIQRQVHGEPNKEVSVMVYDAKKLGASGNK